MGRQKSWTWRVKSEQVDREQRIGFVAVVVDQGTRSTLAAGQDSILVVVVGAEHSMGRIDRPGIGTAGLGIGTGHPGRRELAGNPAGRCCCCC